MMSQTGAGAGRPGDDTRNARHLAQRLGEGPPILLDGGNGTEIERLGATMHPRAWGALAALDAPEILAAVHRAFLVAGAELIIANTYPCNYHIMAAAGLEERFDAANRAALRLALEARREAHGVDPERPIWVAGSMSTTTFTRGIDPAVAPSPTAQDGGYRAQAAIIAESGVDLIVLEMMRDIEQTRLCLEAALETGLPVWVGFSVEEGRGGSVVLHGTELPLAVALSEVLDETTTASVQAVGIMHSELELTPTALDLLAASWGGPTFAYPHHGVFEMPHWRFDNTLTPHQFADTVAAWVRGATDGAVRSDARPAAAVGGCCGIRPAHITALSDRLGAARHAGPAL